ncbi:hypothetical protein ACQPZG_00750 (plasmid) [Streptomyces sp. CA-294286]|uniref:hypothetical protein n=1 Tax=Streptomyces sp. CA-294286 TaxID=3240070 RepID=UPI003D8A4E04
MKRVLVPAAVSLAAVLSLASCSDNDASPKEEGTKAASELCTDLSELRADQAKLAALDPASATKDQVKEAYEAVQDDWKDVSESLGDLDEAKRNGLRSAADDLKKAYEDLPGDTSGKDALSKVKPQIQKLGTTVQESSRSVNCT